MCLLVFITGAWAQREVTGKITDAETGEPLAYVTVFVKLPNHINRGTSTDFSGIYHLVVPQTAGDSIYASYVGYYTTAKKRLPVTDFQLKTNTQQLQAVKVTPKSYINPAWEILENVVKHKVVNDQEYLNSYGYKSYSRLAVAITNLSDKMKQRKIMKQILPLMDTLHKMAGDEGKTTLPVFAQEQISHYYHQRSPDLKTEQVERTKVSGIAIEDQTLISQLIGSSFQQYNFYKNYLRLAGKDFISPITDSWKTFYNYELVDAHDKIDGKEYYKIEFKPKRSHDLAFIGVMWITNDDTYALYRIDVAVTPDANLDFLNKIRIQQEMIKPGGGTAWVPEKTRIVVHVSNLSKNWSGFIGNYYLSNSDFEVNKVYPRSLFKEPLVLGDSIDRKDESFWTRNRPEPLTESDKRVYHIIDTVKNLPIVRTYADIASMLINGYYKMGKFSYGPYLYTYSYNDVQGSVLRLGGITNKDFSNRLVLGGYVSYGFRDRSINYNGSVDYIVSRKPWTEAGISYSHDIDQTGYQFENFSKSNNVFKASIRNGKLTRRGPFVQNQFISYIQRDLSNDFRAKLTVDHRTFVPLYNFEYFQPGTGQTYVNYQVSEAVAELQWTPGRRILQSARVNKRITLGNGEDNPIVTFRYTHGFKVLDGDFNYNKFAANVQQKLHMGIFGKGDYSFTAGYIPSSLPYPLLENHRYNFNTMRFLEFTSDKFVSLNYTQHMEGLLTNSIPLLKALNIRTVADLNVLDGTESAANSMRRPSAMPRPTRSLQGIPYVEAGYGVENILKFIRVDFLYRLTHRDHIDDSGVLPSNFAARFTLQFRL